MLVNLSIPTCCNTCVKERTVYIRGSSIITQILIAKYPEISHLISCIGYFTQQQSIFGILENASVGFDMYALILVIRS